MSESEQSGEKTEQPTLKKLQDARTEGNIPRSNDLTTAIALLGFLTALATFSTGGIFEAIRILANALADPEGTLSNQQATGMPKGFAIETLRPIVWVFLLPALAAVAALLAQNSVTFSTKKIIPKLSKISPATSVKNKYGRAGLFEFLKSSVKLLIFSFFVGAFLLSRADEIVATTQLMPTVAIASIGNHAFDFMIYVCIIMIGIGTVDFGWQYQDHYRKNMMSRKEVQDEQKESEGDPHTKNQRRQRGYEIAMNQMLSSVPEADVVIVNPTHYAVALKWEPASGRPPICVAKGVDEIAARIRGRAKEAGVPIYSSPATARSIYAKIEIGDIITQESYRAVAAAIRFANDMKLK